MMMPANYSVIAENEMTYVVGGGLFDALPSLMTSANWKNVTTNLVMVVGNAAMSNVLNNTLGVMFGGHWGDKTKESETLFGSHKDGDNTVYDGTISSFFMGTKTPLNKVMGTIAGLASIYALGTKTIGVDNVKIDAISF